MSDDTVSFLVDNYGLTKTILAIDAWFDALQKTGLTAKLSQ